MRPWNQLGFDSLALVSVVSGLKPRRGTEFPAEYWEGRQTLHLVDLVDAVERFSPGVEQHAAAGASRPAPPPPPEDRRERSLPGALVATIARRIFSRLDVVIVERLLTGDLPRPVPPPGIVLRPATIADLGALADMWPRPLHLRKLRQFRGWLADGYTCLAAFDRERAVAVDWLNETDDEGDVAAVAGDLPRDLPPRQARPHPAGRRARAARVFAAGLARRRLPTASRRRRQRQHEDAGGLHEPARVLGGRIGAPDDVVRSDQVGLATARAVPAAGRCSGSEEKAAAASSSEDRRGLLRSEQTPAPDCKRPGHPVQILISFASRAQRLIPRIAASSSWWRRSSSWHDLFFRPRECVPCTARTA